MKTAYTLAMNLFQENHTLIIIPSIINGFPWAVLFATFPYAAMLKEYNQLRAKVSTLPCLSQSGHYMWKVIRISPVANMRGDSECRACSHAGNLQWAGLSEALWKWSGYSQTRVLHHFIPVLIPVLTPVPCQIIPQLIFPCHKDTSSQHMWKNLI